MTPIAIFRSYFFFCNKWPGRCMRSVHIQCMNCSEIHIVHTVIHRNWGQNACYIGFLEGNPQQRRLCIKIIHRLRSAQVKSDPQICSDRDFCQQIRSKFRHIYRILFLGGRGFYHFPPAFRPVYISIRLNMFQNYYRCTSNVCSLLFFPVSGAVFKFPI